MCVLEIAKYCFPLRVCLAFMRLLIFVLFCSVLATVHVVNALESNTVYSLQVFFVSWSCLRAVRERRGREEGERSGCRGKRRLCLMRSHPGNPMTPPSQPPPPCLPHLSTWPPLSVPTHSNPPPPTERAVRGAESRNTHPGSCYSAAAKGRQARHTRRQKHKTRTWKRKRLGCEFLRG